MSSNVRSDAPTVPGAASDDARTARDRLLQKIKDNNGLPALGGLVSQVVQLASSDINAVRELAHLVLSDVALTQKVLRLSNTVGYRTASGRPITTISKAIFLLGFDTVKTGALAMLLVDSMKGRQAHGVRAELACALSASVVGRELARRSQYRDAEEAAVAALFRNMGRLLVAAHDYALYDEAIALIESGTYTPSRASLQVLGCSFDMLGESVLQEWQIPETIIQSLTPLPSGALKPAKSRQEWLQQVAAFSTAAATLLPRMDEPGSDEAGEGLLARFGAALNLNQDTLTELLVNVAQETRILTKHADLMLPPVEADAADAADTQAALDSGAAALTDDETLPDELLLAAAGNMNLQIDARHASGKPVNARDLLLAGVQDATEMMASGRCKANDLIMLVLESLYNSLGFRFATICLRDIRTNQFRARIALGENHTARQAGFAFSTDRARDVFHLALENDADVMISDVTSEKIRSLIPDWHRALLPDTGSFIVLPLIVQKKPFGLFYADRAQPAPEGVPPEEAALIKTLKGQVLAVLNPR